MSEIATIAATIFKRAGKSKRFVVAIAGAPGSGKSTLSHHLLDLFPEGSATIVQMDGFHFDNAILHARGLHARKGAPETFDYAGFVSLLRRIRSQEPEIAVPVFDRSMEVSRAGASIIDADVKFVLVEGNYLLLDEPPWNQLSPFFDYAIYLDLPRNELERRLMQRWHEHGKSDEEARRRIATNDLPNIERVMQKRRPADLVVQSITITE